MSRVRLEETKDWQLADRSHDVRGRELRDSVGRALGTIKTMIVDTDARRVESVVLEDGNEYPVRDLQIMEQAVYFVPTAAEPLATPASDAAYAAPDAGRAPEYVAPASTITDSTDSVLEPRTVPADLETSDTVSAPEAPAAPRFTWQPAVPAQPVAPGAVGEQGTAAQAPAGWSSPSAGDETPAPPALDPVPDEPDATPAYTAAAVDTTPDEPLGTSPYAPPAYAPPAYNPPSPPPPYVAPSLSGEPAIEAQREGYTEAVTPPDALAAMEAPAVPPPAPPETYYAGPSVSPPAPPAADPLADPYAAPAFTYAEPTGADEVVEREQSITEDAIDASMADDLEEHSEPPPLRPESASDAFTPSGLEAGGLATGAFGTPPTPSSFSDSRAESEVERAMTDSVESYPEPDVRPAAPLFPGGASFVAPPEPGHSAGSYAGVAPEPGFPTHAAPIEAAVHHTGFGTPADEPLDTGYIPPGIPSPEESYRAHFDEHYAEAGGDYDDLASAYRFGADAATDPELRDADDDTLRRRFNLRNGYPETDRWAWMSVRNAVLFAKGRG